MLTPGQPAPDFVVTDESGTTHRLADYAGKTLVLWFYPKADTPGWTAQGQGFRDRISQFEAKNAVVLGASMDDAAANAAFRTKFEFPFALLCDTSGELCRAYGAAVEGDQNATRAAVIIGPDGSIVRWWPKVDAKTFPESAIAELP